MNNYRVKPKVFLLVILSIFICLETPIWAQKDQRKIVFPDLPDYLSLKCDFHIHTVFSDGSVWPNIRVEEAVKDGLDAISLTEHLEYQPHKDDIPHPDRNRSYFLAKEAAKPHDLLIIHGAEITRKMPPGHANALFIKDANLLNVRDSLEAYREAKRQEAFVFWNHPNWVAQQSNGIPIVSDFHKMLIANKLLHGIEVVNDVTFSAEAVDAALRYNLTMLGTSDIHGLVDWSFGLGDGGHRPISIVFSKERTEDAIKEALFAGRTVAWFNNLLIGKEEYLLPLVKQALKFKDKGLLGRSSVHIIEITNNSSAKYSLENLGEYSFYMDGDLIEIEPYETKLIHVITTDANKIGELTFRMINGVIGYKKTMSLSFTVEMSEY